MGASRLLAIFHREIRGLHEAAYLVAIFTLGSQVMALVRDRLLAHEFGAGATLDVFYAAFRVPDTLYALVASLVSLFVLIPFFESAEQRGSEAVRRFISNMFSFFSLVLVSLGSIAFLFAPQLVSFLYGGFSDAMREELVGIVRVLLLQPLLLGVSNLFAAYVQTKGRFLLYALAPLLYNLGIIIGIVAFYPLVGTIGLAWGVVLGALFHVGTQTPFMRREGMLPRFMLPDWREVFAVVRISVPRTIALSTQQLVLLILVSLASFYAVGSVSVFNFAWNLQAVPLALIGVSYSVAAFPKLARLFGNGEHEAYVSLIAAAARQIIFLGVPATVLFIVLRSEVVAVVLGTGAFDERAMSLTAASLALLVVSLVAQGLVVLLVRACYAAGKTLAPLVLTATSALATVVLALVLLRSGPFGSSMEAAIAALFRIEGIEGGEVLLLTVAYTAGSMVNAVLLFAYFERRSALLVRRVAHTAWHSFVASLAGGFVALLARDVVAAIVSTHATYGVVVVGSIAGVVGVCAWVIVLLALRNDDILSVWHGVRAKILQSETTRV